MATRFLSEVPLHVAVGLRRLPLASPLRRAVAFALDCAILIVPSVAVAIAVVAVSLEVSQPRVLAALRTLAFGGASVPAGEQHAALRELAPLLARLRAEGLPEEVGEAVRANDLDRAADLLGKRRLLIAMSLSEHTAPNPAAGTVRFPLERLIPKTVRGVTLYGVAALYFGLFTRGRRGATPGKRMAGIRVVRLDGERLSLYESLERFVGYLHLPASLFIDLVDFWRDPNRRLPHDRVAHTAVLRVVRAARRAKA
jgi:uncharacterized RDD family membrane protein YckC